MTIVENDNLVERLAAAREKAAALRTTTEALNERLKLVESALVSLNLGVTAAVPLLQTNLGVPVFELKFRRHDGVWRLLVESGGGTETLEKSARDMRVRAAGALPALVDVLLASIDEEQSRVSSGIKTLDSLIERADGWGR